MASSVERYAVHWVDLDPVRGSEIAKTRPALVVSDDAMNQMLSTVVVCPVTSRLHPRWPSRVRTNIAGREAEIAIDQIRTIDKARLGERIDAISAAAATEVRHIITEMYGLLSVR
jgi:mRNA interferase MazF